MMVMQKSKPTIRQNTAASHPKNIIHIKFATGCFSKFVFTVLPKGKITSFAILKHCIPKGMPTTVMYSIAPRMKR